MLAYILAQLLQDMQVPAQLEPSVSERIAITAERHSLVHIGSLLYSMRR